MHTHTHTRTHHPICTHAGGTVNRAPSSAAQHHPTLTSLPSSTATLTQQQLVQQQAKNEKKPKKVRRCSSAAGVDTHGCRGSRLHKSLGNCKCAHPSATRLVLHGLHALLPFSVFLAPLLMSHARKPRDILVQVHPCPSKVSVLQRNYGHRRGEK